MLQAQAIVVKNRKNLQTSSSKLTKAKSSKSENGDKAKLKATASEKQKPKLNRPPVQNRHGSVNYSPNLSETNNFAERKLERANTFFLTRQLTKIYDSLANSKESLKDNEETTERKDKKPAFKFMRSVSLAAISLKKDYRNSMRKPKLEHLPEEDHQNGIPIPKSKQTKEKKSRTVSVDSLSSRTSDMSSMISSFKRTFSLTPSRRKPTNPKWSASLMSLQQIDVMISYEDLSFIDYDKFNTYEENLMTKIKSSKQNVNHMSTEQLPAVRRRTQSNVDGTQRRHSTAYPQNDEQTVNWLNARSKRWSNPCISPNIECASYPSYPSYASIVKSQASIGADECDYSANESRFKKEHIVTPSNVAHSVDDLTGKSDHSADLLLQAVSTFLIFHFQFAHFILMPDMSNLLLSNVGF